MKGLSAKILKEKMPGKISSFFRTVFLSQIAARLKYKLYCPIANDVFCSVFYILNKICFECEHSPAFPIHSRKTQHTLLVGVTVCSVMRAQFQEQTWSRILGRKLAYDTAKNYSFSSSKIRRLNFNKHFPNLLQ